jgi:hypothetical protein
MEVILTFVGQLSGLCRPLTVPTVPPPRTAAGPPPPDIAARRRIPPSVLLHPGPPPQYVPTGPPPQSGGETATASGRPSSSHARALARHDCSLPIPQLLHASRRPGPSPPHSAPARLLLSACGHASRCAGHHAIDIHSAHRLRLNKNPSPP